MFSPIPLSLEVISARCSFK
ncbi:hypothetical protein HU200_004884 [Digitaria exilis]|uniref:Uncharacterized protein n=1 Tax=Digitaria exilis TaxID=1010633 RepID=A0A835EVT7_9POAL|nr:hypothetical protein HU200_025973 [Digitaria exilis]KAF8775459.1 hypothetical protein HU200_004884 [Digitaria exilis]